MPCRFQEILDSILNWKILDSILNWKILDSNLNWKFSQTSGTVLWDVVVISCSGWCVCLSRDTQLTKSPKPGDDLAWSDPQIRLITWEVEKPSTS